jgi:hypothetical protein
MVPGTIYVYFVAKRGRETTEGTEFTEKIITLRVLCG